MDVNKQNNIRNMTFPDQDHNWLEIVDLLQTNGWENGSILACVEFCALYDNSVPYEWSYWRDLISFDCIILHKGMLDRLKTNFLDGIDESHEYVFGNSVFNVYIKRKLNINNLKGHRVHFSIHTLIHGLKRVLKINKQYKAKIRKKNILLVTANHSGNIGDDAITLASKDILESVYPEANIVIDKGPASKELIGKVDLVVLGGGGIFYDNCFYNAQNYCQYFLYADELGIKSCAIGIGAQGIKTPLGIELYRRAINCSEFIAVRDKHSLSSLRDTVKVDVPVIVNQDVVYTLQSIGNRIIKRNTQKPLLLFSLLDASRMPTARNTIKYQDSQEECMALLAEKFEVKLLVQSRDDLNLYNKLCKRFNLDIISVNFDDVYQIINIYKQADLVITSRLHGFIFAAQAQVPIITVASKNTGSKLGSMVFDSVPSAAKGYIVLKEYDLKNLKDKLSIYNEDANLLIPDISEIKACQKLASKLNNIFLDYIPQI